MEKQTEKSFNSNIATIKKGADALAGAIHSAGLFALAQANEHGNIGFAVRLVEAMGKKHDAQRVVKWLCHFGKFDVKKGEIVYRNRKDIQAENLDAKLNEANDTPYWVLTLQAKLTNSVDYQRMFISSMKAIISRHEKIEQGGEKVEEKNVQFIDKARQLLATIEGKATVAA